MIRVLLTELLKTAFLLAVVSVVGFVALDATGKFDWWGTSELAARAGIPMERALARDLPLVWNRRVADARVRTTDDLEALASPTTRAAARERLLHRGTAGLPTILRDLGRLPVAGRDGALEILATLAPTITGGEVPPADRDAALAYWDRFFALRGLDFRPAYAHRLVQRLVEHESRNAEEQLVRLGTFALPAIFDVLDQPVDTAAAQRLTALLSTITGLPLRLAPDARVAQIRDIVETWRAWWFVERLEYESLTDVSRVTGHIGETRYGRWLTRALVGVLGTSRVTGRPIALEVRERALRSLFVGGLGGLLAIAFVVAFGGGRELRKRPLGTKILDLVGALVPGLAALVFGFALLVQVAAAPRPAGPLARIVLGEPVRLALAVLALAPIAALLLRRNYARRALDAVRKEAESWALESRHPKPIQIVRHGARVGLASLLAPLALAALPLVAVTHVVEPLVGVTGMGQLNVRSIMMYDPPWLLIALISVVPIWLAQHWSQRVMAWALGDPSVKVSSATRGARPKAPREAPHSAPAASEPENEPVAARAQASADR